MKILFVSPYPPARDGIGTYTQAMVTALRARGHEAGVLVPRARDHQAGEVLGAVGASLPDREALRSWSPDVIHVQFAVAAYGTRAAALLSWLRLAREVTGAPVVVTMHEVTRDTALLRGPGRALYRRLAACCDHVIVHTHGARFALVTRMGVPGDKVSVIPHPRARPPREISAAAELRARFGLGDCELLLAFGFVHVDKGLDDLVRALGMARGASGPLAAGRVRLVVAGTVRPRHGLFRVFEWRDRIHLSRTLRMAARCGIRDMIVLTGYVPEADVAAWFRAAAAVVLPYRRTEQSGVAGLAGAFGVPVLASTAGGLGEQYGASGWAFPPCAPAELAGVLTRFLAAPAAARATAAVADPAADPEAVIRAMTGVYDRVTRREAVLSGAGTAVGSALDAA
jgi:glycosyltransferase involved in cell wall biosynthesis